MRAAKQRANHPDKVLEVRAKYRERNRERIREEWRMRYGASVEKLADRPFIGWDGEGYSDASGNHFYMLFGCSRYPDEPMVAESLSTKAILDYILYVESLHPNAFHVGFAFNYDVNMILRDLPSHTLKHLAEYGICHWRGYRIQYIRDKIFRVSRKKPVKISVTIFDVFGFFHCKYTTALLKFGVTTREEIRGIEEGKDKRPDFTFADIEYVKAYWQDEISYFPPLMDKLRDACYDAGLYITQWHGPGALASYMIRKRGVRNWKSKDVPPEVQIATQYAYAGGRFQLWKCGLYYHPVYTADLNSAYIYACSLVPRLDNGRWRRVPAGMVDRSRIARFGIYRIAFDRRTMPIEPIPGTHGAIHPLFHRDRYSNIRWPFAVEGWYWSPEASLVKDNPCARFLEAWIYDDDGTYPFQWVDEEYNKRLVLQQQGNPAEKAFKWALASMYGAFARRVGWDRQTHEPPRTHELAWAGFITSWCRAEVYKLGLECWKRDGLVSIDTDGVTSTIPFDPAWLPSGSGDKLGQWKLEEYAGILSWQTGVYWLLDQDGEWTTAKTRGMPRGTVPIEYALNALKENPNRPSFTIKKTTFIGFKDALNRHVFGKAFRWVTEDHVSAMGKGGNGYVHLICPKCRHPDKDIMHSLNHPMPNDVITSYPHRLPWLEEQPGLPENILEIILLIVRDTDIPDNL